MYLVVPRRCRRIDAHHPDACGLEGLSYKLILLHCQDAAHHHNRCNNFELLGANHQFHALLSEPVHQLLALPGLRAGCDVNQVCQPHPREYFMIRQPGPEDVIEQRRIWR